MIDKVVILAAGGGRRLAGVASSVPKPLLPIDGQRGPTFIEWHLRCLKESGVREIYLVGNTTTFGACEAAVRRAEARWILNPCDPSASGSAYSTRCAWNAPFCILDAKSRVLLMDADIVYEQKLLSLFFDRGDGRSKTLVSQHHRETAEEVLVFEDRAAPGLAVVHGKGLSGTPLVAGLSCVGEATGMVLFEPDDHALVRAATDWVVRYSTAKEKSEHEDITQRLMAKSRVRAVPFGAEHLFMEVDTPDEYEVLVNELAPRLLSPPGP